MTPPTIPEVLREHAATLRAHAAPWADTPCVMTTSRHTMVAVLLHAIDGQYDGADRRRAWLAIEYSGTSEASYAVLGRLDTHAGAFVAALLAGADPATCRPVTP